MQKSLAFKKDGKWVISDSNQFFKTSQKCNSGKVVQDAQ